MSPQPYVFPPNPSPQVKVVQEYFKYLSDFDTERLSTLTTEDFTQQTLPASLNAPVLSKAQDLAYLKDLQTKLGGKPLHYTLYEVNDGHGETWAHTKLDTLNLEIVYLFRFGEGPHAHKIISNKEFVDSKSYLERNPPQPTVSSST